MSTDGLIFAYLLDGQGGGKRIGWDEIAAWQPSDGLLWVHLDFSTGQAADWIEMRSGLDPLTSEILIADETRPRVLVEDDAAVAILRGVNTNPGADPEDMVAIRLHLTQQRIISCRRRRLLSVQDIAHDVERGKGPRSSGELLAHLADRLVDRMAEIIAQVDESTDLLEEQVTSQANEALRGQLADIVRSTIRLRRYLSPQRDALMRLAAADLSWLPKKTQSLVRETMDHLTLYLEDLDSARERAGVTQQELLQLLSEHTEKRVYLLTIISAIFLPLGFLTGLLGVNLGGIPASENAWGFLGFCLILLVVLAAQVALLRRKRWL